MIITEEELRGAWRNGRGAMPDFPPGTRFTPAARDFLGSLGITDGRILDSHGGKLNTILAPGPDTGTASGNTVASDCSDGVELCPEAGKRRILTAQDMDEFIAAKPHSLFIHSGVTVTDVARDRLRSAGIRIVNIFEKRPETAGSDIPTVPALQSRIQLHPESPPARQNIQAKITNTADVATDLRAVAKDELFLAAKKRIMERLGDRAGAGESLVEAVLKRVISSL